MDFSKFDSQVDMEQLKNDVNEAKKNESQFSEVEAGTYYGKVEKMEISETRDGRPMFKMQFRITEGDHKKQCLFMNRVVFGTKNDAVMINSVLGFLEKLEPSEDVGPIEFESYSQLNDLVLDVMEDIDEVLEYEVEYDPEAFNNISINEAFEVE